ncbi:MAG: hypothetical protein AAGG65_21830, partial [Pseudomonadota bacterium]
MTIAATRKDIEIWTKVITFDVDAPFDVPDLPTIDPFVIASIFPALEVGGTMRVHGRVTRTLIRNILDFQSAWHCAAPKKCRLFDVQVEAVEDIAIAQEGPEANAIVAFSGGVDATLAFCRNISGDAGPASFNVGATLLIQGVPIGRRGKASEPVIADLRRMSEAWGRPMAVVDTDIVDVIRKGDMSHGTWLAACLMLFGGRYDVGIIGSTKTWFSRGWEVFGSHPLLDRLLSSGLMSIRNDEGLYHRAEKVAL